MGKCRGPSLRQSDKDIRSSFTFTFIRVLALKMRFFETLFGEFALYGLARSECLYPEPLRKICYDQPGTIHQNLLPEEIDWIISFLRVFEYEGRKRGDSPFYKMRVSEAGSCAMWPIAARGTAMAVAQLVVDQDVAITLIDLIKTLEPGNGSTQKERNQSLSNFSTAGGQMGVSVKPKNPI